MNINFGGFMSVVAGSRTVIILFAPASISFSLFGELYMFIYSFYGHLV